ncbi:transcriptional regulator, AraC family [Rhodospirillum rubrum ATCC 11170]|uniref:Transcriptional regulator, AraC family n=2 Tax=Rhodospirillum rubrum TaxID=1085 RepID=Q2RSZ4_RHORT|nr:helix-turn-helix transcriptional regulator [Rhodospirillum rubrum]ABC22751.1 transcriptional regulator, AraC family [Rhodospirillum rubrum ATCC 11170]MBK5954348.1 AraC family transcriptional regulator [Rhodospirillum rubrum]QXG78743.1 helix-turn-helix transcriptional regulator [Rhodospirillum rubrum]HCF17402.1 AraC family transcriptional regulator [Rhodospirillum rubrum]
MVLSRSAVAVFDPDLTDRPAVARQLDFADHQAEVPMHEHRKGQLILALHGAVTCTADNEIWIVPPNCAVWIPGGVPHSARATANARLTYLFVEPGAAKLPEECCTLSISPMIREMVDRLAREPADYPSHGHAARLARVALDELVDMPRERFNLPISGNAKIRAIADALTVDPSDRSTLAEWAKRVAMSERSLARLMIRETGLTFGRWRQQLHLVVALRQLAGGASVHTVAAELGYESVNAFITMFKKALGSTPAQYFVERRALPPSILKEGRHE